MDKKRPFIAACRRGALSLAELCHRYGVSRPIGSSGSSASTPKPLRAPAEGLLQPARDRCASPGGFADLRSPWQPSWMG